MGGRLRPEYAYSRYDRTPLVLLVDDDPAHAALVQRFLEDHAQITHVRDGESSLDYLLHRNTYRDSTTSPAPDLVLLDLRLPRMDGFEVLRRIRADNSLARLPVVILAASTDETDMARAYEHYANSYLVKPATLDEMEDQMDNLARIWLGWNRRHGIGR